MMPLDKTSSVTQLCYFIYNSFSQQPLYKDYSVKHHLCYSTTPQVYGQILLTWYYITEGAQEPPTPVGQRFKARSLDLGATLHIKKHRDATLQRDRGSQQDTFDLKPVHICQTGPTTKALSTVVEVIEGHLSCKLQHSEVIYIVHQHNEHM